MNLEIADTLLKGKSELKMTIMCHFSTCLVSQLSSLQVSEIAWKMKSMRPISTCLDTVWHCVPNGVLPNFNFFFFFVAKIEFGLYF